MKPHIIAATLLLAVAGLPLAAMAACAAPSTRVVATADLSALLTGKTVCVPTNKPGWTWESQEIHQAPNILVDYKKGPSDPVDPSKQVGTWAVTGNQGGQRAVVEYSYTGGQSYAFTVWRNGNSGTHSFCTSSTEVVATIKSGRC